MKQVSTIALSEDVHSWMWCTLLFLVPCMLMNSVSCKLRVRS